MKIQHNNHQVYTIMTNSAFLKKISLATLLILFLAPSVNAQILKRLQKSVERTVERKLEQKTEKETGKIMDSILDPSQKPASKDTPSSTPQNTNEDGGPSGSTSSSGTASQPQANKNLSDGLQAYSKFDFVPGDEVLFFDDFSQDFIGDFPSKWNTNGSGEVVKINNVEGHWFEIKPSYNSFYIPEFSNLPEDYTIEFDLLAIGLTERTSSQAYLDFILSSDNALERYSGSYVYTSVSLRPRGSIAVKSGNQFDTTTGPIKSSVYVDAKDDLLNQPHFAIAVTKNRYRFWINEKKVLDIPKMVEIPNLFKHLKFSLTQTVEGTEQLLISNLRVAKGGEDLRRKLLSEGKISTNGIHFDSGSSHIKPQSMGIILQIAQVLQQDTSINLNIVGHTDADGNSDTNLKLSKQRANAVKEALIKHYNISENRLQTDGKGASLPIADNTTADGKAQNRRVEFIKI